MGQRSISYSNHIIDQQSQEYIRREHCGLYGSFTAFPHPNGHPIAPGNASNLYLHHLPDHQEGTLIYGMSPSNGVQQQHHAPSSNHYNPFMAAPIPVNHDQLPFSGPHGMVGLNGDNYGWNNPYMDSIRGSFKRKDPEVPDTVLQNYSNHLPQGNYVGQAYQFPGSPWLDLNFNSGGSEAENWAWNQAAPVPYLPGGAGGHVDTGNMGVQGYYVTPSNGGLMNRLRPPIPQGPPNHHLPPNFQGHNMSIAPQMPASSRRHQRNSSSNDPFQGAVEGGSRYIGSFPPTGFRFYRPHQREFMLETNTRHRNLLNMTVLPVDGVAILDVSRHHEVRDAVDQHGDMRLDVDHMSYEELLALGEQIGNVTTGISEEFILSNLKTRIFHPSDNPCAPGSSTCFDHKNDVCVICQADYKGQEKIGILECGHEYHEECVKKWLVVKNTCPICKSIALSARKKDL